MLNRTPRKSALIASFTAFALFVFVACGGGGESDETSSIVFPSWMDNANRDIRTAYTFAVNRPDVLQYVPCYCGCGAQGHEHSEHCFVKARYGEGAIVFDQHGYA